MTNVVFIELAGNGLHLRQYGAFVACLPGADDELKRDVETTSYVQPKTVQPRTKLAILLELKL